MKTYFLKRGTETFNLLGRVIRMTIDIFWRIIAVLFILAFFAFLILFVAGICFLGFCYITGKPEFIR